MLSGVDGCCADAALSKVVRHEIGVALGAAKSEGSFSSVFAVLLESVCGAGVRGDGGFEGLFVESGAPPGDVLVVDLVGDADVAEGYEALALDAFEKIAPVDEVFAAEREEVATVGALWGSGETEKKLGLEVVINQ